MAEARMEAIEKQLDEYKKKMEDIETLREKLEDYELKMDRLEKLEKKMQDLEELKDDFADKLKAKLTQMEVDANMKQARHMQDLQQVVLDAQGKFAELDNNLHELYNNASLKFLEIEQALKEAPKGGERDGKKTGFLPEKMMVPKTFSDDVTLWRKWRDDVMKYFDDCKEGMKRVMEDVARQESPITQEVLQAAFDRNPNMIGEQLQKWKHLYRALEKLTEGEAAKVISTVRDENGFEAWRQLHLRFEPELEAQKNTVLLEIHTITPATTIEETKANLVELKVRIAKAEDILGENITERQMKTALLQVMDPITKQHTATIREDNFNKFYTAVMNFTNNASHGGGSPVKSVNSVKEMKKDEEEEQGGEDGWLNAMGDKDKCHSCGEAGHWARNCPYKSKGKGSRKGETPKGKGRGKGPLTGCFLCGGDHYQDQCPRQQLYNKGYGKTKGGKKGYGKGGKGDWQGKGKGGLNGLNTNFQWEDGSWESGEYGYTEAFCSLKTIEPCKQELWQTPKNTFTQPIQSKVDENKYVNKNIFQVLDMEESQAVREEVQTEVREKNAQKKKKIIEEQVNEKSVGRRFEGKDVREEMQTIKASLNNYEKFYGLPPGSATLLQVKASSAGVKGLADARLDDFELVGNSTRRIEHREQEEHNKCNNETRTCHEEIEKHNTKKKKMKKLMPVKSRKHWKPVRMIDVEEDHSEKVKVIKTIEPEMIGAFTEDGIWEEIELSVDSGATESVVPEGMPSSIKTSESPASRRGVEYEVANGERIPNEGEKKFKAVTDEGKVKQMVMQVCDVNQGLLSVSKATAAGNRVVFDSEGSYIQNKSSGDITWLKEKGGMYTLRLWVRRPF